MSLGNNIAKHRKERGLTQKEFAELVGIHKAHVTRIENDRLQPNKTTLAKIAEVLAVSVPELFGARDEADSTPLQDPTILTAFQMAQELSPEDKSVILKIVQALLTKRKMEDALQWEFPKTPGLRSA